MPVTVIRDDLDAMPDAEYETIEEALAEAMRQLDGDGEVHVHTEDCELDEDSDDEDDCTCTPMVLTLGAKS